MTFMQSEKRLSGIIRRQMLFMFGLMALAMFFTPPVVLAKQFIDRLSTDFQGGVEDNIQINENVIGGLQLVPYAMLSSWTTTSSLTNAVYLAATTMYNGKVYLTGGRGVPDTYSSGPQIDTTLTAIHFANVQSDGSIEKWDPEDQVNLPQPTYGHACVAMNGRMYIIGGRAADSPNSTYDAVYWGKIMGYNGLIQALYNPNTWTAVANLPKALYRPAAVQFEGRIFVIGGQDNTNAAQDAVYYADVQPSGDIPSGSWRQTSAPLPTPLSGHSALISNGRIYVIGGSATGEPHDAQQQVYMGTIDPTTQDILAWQATTPLPEPLYDAAATVSCGKIFVCGGSTSTTAKATATVYFAAINQGTGLIPGAGERDTWTRGTDLPTAMTWHNLVSFNGHLLVMGGTNNSGAQEQTYTTALVNNKQNILNWKPTTPLFLSAYGGNEYSVWSGHRAVIKVPLLDSSSLSSTESTQPTIYVVGGAPNTFNACADGNLTFPAPGAYATVYQANIDSNGSVQNWSADPDSGQLPLASILHATALAMNNQTYVIGGVNSANAGIFGGARSLSITADPYEYVGRAHVFYENIASGSSTGTFEQTGFIPIRDPSWLTNTVTPVYQPLVRAAAASYNDVIYVVGGISRQNIGAVLDPTGSVAVYENRVWYCRPNAGGSINGENQIGGWQTTTPLPIPMYDVVACVANKRLYLFGGRDSAGNPRDSIYFAEFNPDGSLGPWNPTTPMPMTLAEHQVVFTSGRLYILGGSRDATGGSLQNVVYYCTPDAATGDIPLAGQYGAWEMSTTLLQHPVAGHAAVATNGFIYVLGGRYSVTPSSSAYMSSIADISYRVFQSFAWEGTFERFIDLDYDQLIDNLDWIANTNGQTVNVKCRYALEKGVWSNWFDDTAYGRPIPAQRMARYVHYKINMQTNANLPPTSTSPLVTQVSLNYAASKRVDEDSLVINHNRFDPQTEQLMVSYTTRTRSVSNVIIRVYNLEGELIRRHDIDIPANEPLPATGVWFWDGTNENAELVANGVYIIQYNSGDTHKTRKVLVYKR